MFIALLLLNVGFQAPAKADACVQPKAQVMVDGRDRLADIENANASRASRKMSKGIPAFLQKKIGDGPGQISEVVLKRARALHMRKDPKHPSDNDCYMAMDATRPHLLNEAEVDKSEDDVKPILEDRLYLICESLGIFKTVPVAHGGGVDLRKQLPGVTVRNGRSCARNFGSVLDSKLTSGGNYWTDKFKALPEVRGRLECNGSTHDYERPFLSFTGEGDTANAKERDIGAHPLMLLANPKMVCEPNNPLAGPDGYVYVANGLKNYNGGRTSGCLGMPEDEAIGIMELTKSHPTTIYVYPEKRDIRNLAAGKKTYWNSDCLKEIKKPVYYARGEDKNFDEAVATRKRLADEADAEESKKRPPCKPAPRTDTPAVSR